MVTYAHNPGTEEYQTSLGCAVHSGAPLRGRGTEREGGGKQRDRIAIHQYKTCGSLILNDQKLISKTYF